MSDTLLLPISQKASIHTVNIILCDDDRTFLENFHAKILAVLAKLPVQATIQLSTGLQELSNEQLTTCDMAFLDVDFVGQDSNGMDIARKLREVNSRALIFFITNY